MEVLLISVYLLSSEMSTVGLAKNAFESTLDVLIMPHFVLVRQFWPLNTIAIQAFSFACI